MTRICRGMALCWLAVWLVLPTTFAAPLLFRANEVVALLGGEDMVECQQFGYLELLLTREYPAEKIRFRDLAWEGDTVHAQQRELNFPAWPEQLKRVEATVILAQFGQAESLRGKEAQVDFLSAYEKFLNQLQGPGRRVVLVSPTPFEKPDGKLPDLTARNPDLKNYIAGIKELAARRGCAFVDLFGPLAGVGKRARFTRDGLHLNARGHWLAAREIARQLSGGRTATLPEVASDDGKLGSPQWEQLRRVIVQKNQYWFEYWRPENWAFLNGDRTEQPSSRDHRDPKIRWFPQEMEQFVPLISAREAEIAGLATQLAP
ncbi:MAG TPA: GDSL-type esterase/lipase family protein [Verrucomicrobiae bacterium]|nr:GDSL-type esterase/lipase family protein [Verrucomicrobiae bacterium]